MENPQSIFLRIFGDTPKLRIMDYLVVNDEYDHSMKDIALNAGIGYSTIKLFWEQLIDEGIIRQTRKVGKANMYVLNKDNDAVKHFIKLYWATIQLYVRKKVKVKCLIK